ncbi:type II secretion system protein GspE [Zoogloea oleivorans]|uniref:Type II secretion system protein GspE n=2 Tax=Zoogloea oleivorans TaxID=1552750 RepID=A0A6C2D264_9RHOO|nr:type II secretion system protein GspE [Zoogloea oleivorans]
MLEQQISFDEAPHVMLGDMLVADGKLGARDLERALSAQVEMGGMLGSVLIRLGVVSDLDVARALSRQLGVPLIVADAFPGELPLPEGVAPDFLVSHRVLPLAEQDGVLTVVCAEPQNAFVVKALRLATGLEIRVALGLENEIETALKGLLEAPSEDGEASDDGDGFDTGGDFIEHLKDLASEAPVIRLVNHIVARVIDLRASDIHLEPFDDGLHVRYRVDGVIQMGESVAPAMAAAVVSRIKLLAHLNIAERRLPQDGRINLRIKGRELDLRVSTVPTVHGESVVMRVLDRASIRFSLHQMGFSKDTLEAFESLLLRPHGILLVTGPTGSGKTTTLYAALSKLDAQATKIITVEDPVEYQLGGINQIQVHPQIGLSFASALRAILRQDPDIIMIGEMRDGETAQIAVQSALTGHLVLSTLHTNTAAGAVIRLQDMGLERYLITSAVNGVLAQRLVRKLCEACKVPVDLDEQVLQRSGLKRFMPPGSYRVFNPQGCPACRQTGYVGRTGIHELFVLGESMHKAIISGADATALHETARKSGMFTLYEDGLRKVALGETSLEEVLHVTQDQSNA